MFLDTVANYIDNQVNLHYNEDDLALTLGYAENVPLLLGHCAMLTDNYDPANELEHMNADGNFDSYFLDLIDAIGQLGETYKLPNSDARMLKVLTKKHFNKIVGNFLKLNDATLYNNERTTDKFVPSFITIYNAFDLEIKNFIANFKGYRSLLQTNIALRNRVNKLKDILKA